MASTRRCAAATDVGPRRPGPWSRRAGRALGHRRRSGRLGDRGRGGGRRGRVRGARADEVVVGEHVTLADGLADARRRGARARSPPCSWTGPTAARTGATGKLWLDHAGGAVSTGAVAGALPPGVQPVTSGGGIAGAAAADSAPRRGPVLGDHRVCRAPRSGCRGRPGRRRSRASEAADEQHPHHGAAARGGARAARSRRPPAPSPAASGTSRRWSRRPCSGPRTRGRGGSPRRPSSSSSGPPRGHLRIPRPLLLQEKGHFRG